jgi:hypothetical protein
MLVVPKGIRPESLFVHEIPVGFHMRDFGHPVEGNAQNGAYMIFNNLAGIHFLSVMPAQDLKSQIGRGNIF